MECQKSMEFKLIDQPHKQF